MLKLSKQITKKTFLYVPFLVAALEPRIRIRGKFGPDPFENISPFEVQFPNPGSGIWKKPGSELTRGWIQKSPKLRHHQIVLYFFHSQEG